MKVLMIIASLFFFIVVNANITNSSLNSESPNNLNFKDSLNYKEIKGFLKDVESRTPVVFANVFIIGTSIGTVSNLQGEFILKIPHNYMDGEIGISSLGYRLKKINIKNAPSEYSIVELLPTPFSIEEVVIRNQNPLALIREAKYNIDENYGGEPAMLTGFYRETIKQNRRYISVSEAVLDVYKSSYRKIMDSDRIKIYKGRNSQDHSRIDTLSFKLQGGPYNAFLTDIVKHPGEVLGEEFLGFYDFKLKRIISIEDRDSYMIQFTPKLNEPLPVYEGNIYIDIKTLAFVGADFKINEKKLRDAAKMMIIKKPASMNIEIPGANYLVKYRMIDQRWYLNYIRTEAEFKIKWNKKLFNSTYTVMVEMAVTDSDLNNIIKHSFRESTRSQDILSESVENFEDPDFWGEYNIIVPDQSIEEAVKKLNRKLKRKKP